MKTIITKNIIVLSIISLLLSLSACSKYEDGPWISFRSIEDRILGNYRVELLIKNDSDFTSFWNDNYDLTFIFHNAEDPTYYAHYMKVEGNIIVGGIPVHFFSESDYSVMINHDIVELSFQQHIDSTIFPNKYFYPLLLMPSDPYITFTLTRLAKNQMWLKHTNGCDSYIIHFKE